MGHVLACEGNRLNLILSLKHRKTQQMSSNCINSLKTFGQN